MGAIRFIFRKEVIARLDGDPYLIRWHILHTKWGRVMLHKILKSDEGCAHDHPWSFVSIMLWGSYMELQYKETLITHVRRCCAPAILRRPANFTHKLVLRKPCWTLVFTSAKKREWGFWTPRGWVYYKNYSSRKTCD